MSKVYLASGPESRARTVVSAVLSAAGHAVFDRCAGLPARAIAPALAQRPPGSPPAWERDEQDLALLEARVGALEEADAVVVIVPCDRGSLWDLGLAQGWGALVVAWLEEPEAEPDLELAHVDAVCATVGELVAALADEEDAWQ